MIPSQKSCEYKCDAFSSPRSFNGPIWEFTFMHTLLLVYLVIGCEIVSCEIVGCEIVGCEIVGCEIVSCEIVSCEIAVVSLSVASLWLWNPLTSIDL